jgi:UPF0716 protein FxsA
MFLYLILLFTLIPVIELAVLLKAGQYIGVFNTIFIVLLTGVVGAYLAKSQGLMILRRIRTDLESGIMPGDSLFDGVLILIGGILLLTPGFITDFTGFLALIPFTRTIIRNFLKKQIKKNFADRNIIDIQIDDFRK